MRAGQIIERADLTIERARMADGLYVDERKTVALEVLKNSSVPVRSLKAGMGVPVNLYDSKGVLMLPAGAVVTVQLIDQLRRRGLIKLHAERKTDEKPKKKPQQKSAPAAPLKASEIDTTLEQTAKTSELDEQITSDGIPDLILPHGGDVRPAIKTLSLPSLREATAQGQEQVCKTVDELAAMAGHILRGRTINAGAVSDLLQPFIDLMRYDPCLPLLMLQLKAGGDEEYLYRHGVNVAMISMSVANRLGYPRQQVTDMGIGAMFQDIGMLRVPRSIRFAPRKLTQDEWLEIERHPILTVDTMERIQSLSMTSFIVSYQSHERCDQTGYPRRRHHQFIHPMARIVAAADTYAAVIGERPHRDAGLPYRGMATLLREVTSGKLDNSVVRAFLDTMSLFPVGSYVRLSDGTLARVLRPNGGEHKKPIVVPLDEKGRESDVELDLSADDSLHISEALHEDEVPTPDQPAEGTNEQRVA